MLKILILFRKNQFQSGFTLIEIVTATIITTIVITGIWSVYYSIINIFYREENKSTIQYEGERIINYFVNGGRCCGKKIFGLNSNYPKEDYPKIGYETIDGLKDCDYKIAFYTSLNFIAVFYIQSNDSCLPTSSLKFALLKEDEGIIDGYPVLISDNVLQRNTHTDPDDDSEKTWLKAHKLPPTLSYCTGVCLSFYLIDFSKHCIKLNEEFIVLKYNNDLKRTLNMSEANSVQTKQILQTVPIPKFFSTVVYFSNR